MDNSPQQSSRESKYDIEKIGQLETVEVLEVVNALKEALDSDYDIQLQLVQQKNISIPDFAYASQTDLRSNPENQIKYALCKLLVRCIEELQSRIDSLSYESGDIDLDAMLNYYNISHDKPFSTEVHNSDGYLKIQFLYDEIKYGGNSKLSELQSILDNGPKLNVDPIEFLE